MQELVPPMRTRMYQCQQKVKDIKVRIHTWNKEYFGNNFQEKKILLADIESTHKKGMEEGWDEELRQQEKELFNQIEARER